MVNYKSESIPEDHEIFTEPGLSMGQRIMNHKFAKMSIWEFLGWSPKEKENKMTWLEAENEIWKNRLKLERQMAEKEARRMRDREEWNKIHHYQQLCLNLMFGFGDDLPYDDFRDWILEESSSAYLPVSFGKILKKLKNDGYHVPSTHLYLL